VDACRCKEAGHANRVGSTVPNTERGKEQVEEGKEGKKRREEKKVNINK
jgi:hypothetical protein